MKRVLPLLSLMATSGGAFGFVVNIDFNHTTGPTPTYSGQAAVVDPGNDTWNAVTRNGSSNTITANDLMGSNNVATTVDFTMDQLGSATIAQGNTATDQEVNAFPDFSDLMGDYLGIDAGPTSGVVGSAAGSFTSLTPNAFYELYFYGQGTVNETPANNSGQNSLFEITNGWNGTVIGTAKQTGYDGTPGGDGDLDEGVEYVKFSAQADGTGAIYFRWSNVVPGVNVVADQVPDNPADGARVGALNGIQIVSVVPEPTTALLGMFGLVGLALRRRR